MYVCRIETLGRARKRWKDNFKYIVLIHKNFDCRPLVLKALVIESSPQSPTRRNWSSDKTVTHVLHNEKCSLVCLVAHNWAAPCVVVPVHLATYVESDAIHALCWGCKVRVCVRVCVCVHVRSKLHQFPHNSKKHTHNGRHAHNWHPVEVKRYVSQTDSTDDLTHVWCAKVQGRLQPFTENHKPLTPRLSHCVGWKHLHILNVVYNRITRLEPCSVVHRCHISGWVNPKLEQLLHCITSLHHGPAQPHPTGGNVRT